MCFARAGGRPNCLIKATGDCVNVAFSALYTRITIFRSQLLTVSLIHTGTDHIANRSSSFFHAEKVELVGTTSESTMYGRIMERDKVVTIVWLHFVTEDPADSFAGLTKMLRDSDLGLQPLDQHE